MVLQKDKQILTLDLVNCEVQVIMLHVVFSFAVMVAVLPYMLALVVAVSFFFYQLQKYYRPAARDCQRLDSIASSPV